MFKNFLWIFLLSLIPAVFVGLLLSPFQIFEFMNIYSALPVINFSSVFLAIMNLSWVSVILIILGLVVTSIFASCIFGQMEKHMRSGKLKFNSIGVYVNNNILVVGANLAILLIMYVVLTFLLSTIIFFLHLIFSGLMSSPTIVNTVIVLIFCSAIFVLFLQLVAIFLLNIPNMAINGYNAKTAFSNSLKLLHKNNFQYMLAMIVPFVLIIPVVSLLSGTSFVWIANLIGFLFVMMYYTSLTMTGYFELSNTARYDNRKYYYSYK
jgi:hypothetical protein